jgi:hypothetical protein
MNKSSLLKSAALLALAPLLLLPSNSYAQHRDHLTPEEIELVRDNQALDKRTEVFVKAAERRMLAATNPEEFARQSAKDKEKWGEVKGTRVQLFYDVSRILEEASTNIDDSASHNPDSPLLRKSLYVLSESVARILPQLSKLRESAQEESEADQLDRAIGTAQEIADAARDHGVKAEDLKVKDAKAGKKGN